MPEPVGASYQTRLDRAYTHLNVLTTEIHRWLDRAMLLPDEEVDPASGETVVHLSELHDPVPEAWGPMIGDVLHNLRSSLDHLVHALTVAHAGQTLDPALERQTEFPIYETEDLFRGNAPKRLRGVSADARDAIEALQPFQRGTNSGSDPLWLLHQLSNIDKHRRPTVTALHVEPMIQPEDTPGFELRQPGHVDRGERFVLGTYRADSEGRPPGRYGFGYDVAFREELATPSPSVKFILWSIWGHINGNVIPSLARFT